MNNSRNLIVIFFVFLMIPMGFVMYIPALGIISKDLHTTSGMVGLTLSVYFVGVALSQLFYGSLSDKIGRKKTIMLGYFIFVIGSVLCVFATSINQLIAYRLLQGLGFGCDASVGAAILKDMYRDKEKMFFGVISFSQTAFGLAALIFPIIGGFILVSFGWRAIFAFMGIYALLIILAIKFFLKETKHTQQLSKVKLTISEYKKILFDYRYLSFLIALSLAGAVFPIFQIIGTNLQNRINLDPVIIGYSMTIVGASYMAGTIFNALYLQKVSVKTSILTLILIFLVSCISVIILSLFSLLNFYAILIPSCFIFFACAGLYPNFMSSAISRHPKYSGTCAGHVGFAAYLGGSIITAIISGIIINGLIQLSIVYSAQLILIILLYLISQKRQSRPLTHPTKASW